MEAEPDKPDIQTQVLRTTLAEISTSRRDQGAAECCVICLDEISDPSAAHPCGHANFDFVCLVNWLQLHPTCPLCKAVIREVRYGASTFEDGSPTDPKVYRVPQQTELTGDTGTASARTRTGTGGPPNHGSSQGTFEHYFLGRHRLNNRRDGQRRREPHLTTRPTPTPDEAILRRRHIYRNQLYSLHVGSNRLSQYRELTPELFASDPNLVSRARQWIRRELQVFEFLSGSPSPAPPATAPTTTNNSNSSGSLAGATPAPAPAEERTRRRRANNAEFLLEYTVAILKTVDVQGSAGQAEDMLSEFLGRDGARLFLHELRAWLRSPYGSLEAWDRSVQYPEPRPTRREASRTKRSGHVAGEGARAREGGGSEIRSRGDHWRPGKRRYERRAQAGRPSDWRAAHLRREAPARDTPD